MATTIYSVSLRHRSLRCHFRLISSVALARSGPSSAVSVDPEVKRLARLRRFSDIEAILECRKRSRWATSEPFLSSIIVSYAYAGMLRHASRTFDQMGSLGCSPRTAVSLNALLSSYNRSGRHGRVPKLFSELIRKHSIEPDKVSYGVLIKALCEVGSPERAYPVLKEMEDKRVEVSTVTYTTIIAALYKNGKPGEAEMMWREMVGRGCFPDVAAYNVRAMHCAHHGKPEDVLRVIGEMDLVGLKPDIITYNLLITCYCKNGKYADAKSAYRSLREKRLSPNAATYRNFMYLLCKNGDFDGAFEVCKEGIEKNKVPDIGPMKMLLQGLAMNGREKNARWLVSKLRESFPQSVMREWEKVEDQLGLSFD